MTLWMLWATAVTALLGLAALLGERTLRVGGRQGRWMWIAAITGAMVLQVWSFLRPVRPGSPGIGADGFLGDALGSLPVFIVEGIEVAAVSAPALLERLEPFVLVAWLGTSLVLLAGLAGGLLRLRRQATRWGAGSVEGLEVLVSEDFGPALVGVWSPRIVVPRWAFSLTSEALRMVCVHEDEHRAARDTWLLFGGALLVTITPWNAALWWQVIRLRQAIEVDCDRRVLNTGVSKSSYGALLLEFGAHPRGVTASVAALAHPTSLLERRLTMMMTDVKRAGPIRSAGVLAGVVLLVFAACETPAPTESQTVEFDPSAQNEAPLRYERAWVIGQEGSLVTTPGVAIGNRHFIYQIWGVGQEGPSVTVPGVAIGNQPLIYVDGIRIDGAATAAGSALDDIDPDDIESIEIIKGPEAEALYGNKAAAGIILIVTKAGKPADG